MLGVTYKGRDFCIRWPFGWVRKMIKSNIILVLLVLLASFSARQVVAGERLPQWVMIDQDRVVEAVYRRLDAASKGSVQSGRNARLATPGGVYQRLYFQMQSVYFEIYCDSDNGAAEKPDIVYEGTDMRTTRLSGSPLPLEMRECHRAVESIALLAEIKRQYLEERDQRAEQIERERTLKQRARKMLPSIVAEIAGDRISLVLARNDVARGFGLKGGVGTIAHALNYEYTDITDWVISEIGEMQFE